MDNKFETRTGAELIREYALLIWRWAWLLALCAMLAGGVTYFLTKRQTPIYRASALMEVDAAATSQTVTLSSLTASEQLASTYATEITTKPVLNEVAKRLNLPAFPSNVSIQADAIPDTQLMRVTVQDTNRERVAILCNTLVQVFSDQLKTDQASLYADSKKNLETELANLEQEIQTTANSLAALGAGNANSATQDQLQTALTQYRQTYASVLQSYEQINLAETQSASGIIMKDPAVTPAVPISPRPTRDAILATIGGLLVAVAGIFLVDFLDNSIRDPEEITRKWGVPILGTIINYEHEEDSLITAEQPRSPIAEAFRVLRTNINFTSVNEKAQTFLVTSTSPQDGKTTVSSNLANVIAQGGRKVVVVDADMRRPRIHKVFKMSNRLGLSDQFLHSKDNFDGSLKQSSVEGLQVLTSGNLPPNPSELLGSERMTQILDQLSEQFETTIVDAPPLLTVTDALVLAPRVDGVILVVKPTVTKRAALSNTIDQLKQVHANLLGVVLNDVKVEHTRYYQYAGYYYGKRYSKGYYYSRDGEEADKKSKVALPARKTK